MSGIKPRAVELWGLKRNNKRRDTASQLFLDHEFFAHGLSKVMSVKVKLLKYTEFGTEGEVVEVTNNEAHGLIDRKEAKLVKGYETKPFLPQPTSSIDSAGMRGRGRKRKYIVK